jgi:hypothetical protein
MSKIRRGRQVSYRSRGVASNVCKLHLAPAQPIEGHQSKLLAFLLALPSWVAELVEQEQRM